MGHKGVVSGYTISTSILQLMGSQRNPRVLGRHILVSELRYTIYLGLDWHGSKPLHSLYISCFGP